MQTTCILKTSYRYYFSTLNILFSTHLDNVDSITARTRLMDIPIIKETK